MARPNACLAEILPDFKWTDNQTDKIITAYLRGFPMESVASKVVRGLSPKQAQFFICGRFAKLRQQKLLPTNWQKSYNKSMEATVEEGYTLDEDVELMQWGANDSGTLDTEIFVPGNRCAEGLRRRVERLQSLPGLHDAAKKIEKDAMEALQRADAHVASVLHCEICHRGSDPTLAAPSRRLGARVKEESALSLVPRRQEKCAVLKEEEAYYLAYWKLLLTVTDAREKSADKVNMCAELYKSLTDFVGRGEEQASTARRDEEDESDSGSAGVDMARRREAQVQISNFASPRHVLQANQGLLARSPTPTTIPRRKSLAPHADGTTASIHSPQDNGRPRNSRGRSALDIEIDKELLGEKGWEELDLGKMGAPAGTG